MQILRPLVVVVPAPSHVRLFVTPWTYRAPLSMGFPRQDYWRMSPFSSPGALSDPGIEHTSPAWQVNSFTTEPLGKSY